MAQVMAKYNERFVLNTDCVSSNNLNTRASNTFECCFKRQNCWKIIIKTSKNAAKYFSKRSQNYAIIK